MKVGSKSSTNNTSDSSAGRLFSAPLYAFHVAPPSYRTQLDRDISIPPFLVNEITDVEMQFYLGVSGTGAPTHYHGHAVNSLAYGEKVSSSDIHIHG